MTTGKKKRGRPTTRRMPERIDATPEEIADVVLRAPPKTRWRFEEEGRRQREGRPLDEPVP